MPRLIAALVRHGDYQQWPNVPSAHQPWPLNHRGEHQSREAVQVLYDTIMQNGWTLVPSIDSSRLLRAWQTATILADGLAKLLQVSLPVESYDALAERSVGCLANLTTAQIETILRQDPRVSEPPQGWKADSNYCLPLQGAESLMQAGERVARHVSESMLALPSDELDHVKIFVGHGAAFRHAACCLGVLEFEQLRQLSMFHCRPVMIEYAQDGKWCHLEGDWKIRPGSDQFAD